MHKVLVDPRAKKQLLAVRPVDQRRLVAGIDALASNPRPSGHKKLQGTEGLYRVRLGDYRIIYQIRDQELLVLVIRIGHRREVYR